MKHPRRLVAVLLATVLGTTLLAAPAAATARGTLVIARAPAEVIELFVEKREGDAWRRVDWTWGNDYTARVLEDTIEFDVPPGDYRVSFQRNVSSLHRHDAPDLTTTFYPGVERAEQATAVAIVGGQTRDLTSFRPLPGGHVTGTAKREDRTPLPANAGVEALQERAGHWQTAGISLLAPDGSYDVGGLGSAPTVLRVFAGGSTTTGGTWQGPDAETFSGSATDLASAERIDVSSGRVTSVDPIAVAPNGTLSGSVRDADGRPLAGVEVEVEHLRGVVRTAPDGSWDVGPVRAGSYDVLLRDPQDRVEFQRRDAVVELRRDTVVDTTHAHHGPVWTEAPSFVPVDRLGMMGQTITVDPGVLKQDDAVVTSIDWYVGPEDSPPRIATGPTYTPPMDSEVDQVHVIVTARRRGVEATARTVRDVMLRHPEYFTGRPTTSTTAPVAHELLTARTGTLSPTPSTTTWQWLRDGKAIKGATGTRYRPTASDVGRNVVAQATVQRPGYVRAVVRSTSRDVTSARSSVKATLTPRGGRRVAVSAKVTVAKVSAAYVDGSLDLYRSRKGSDRIGTIRVVDGRATTTLARQPRGKRTYWVRFRPSRDGMTTSQGARTSTRVR